MCVCVLTWEWPQLPNNRTARHGESPQEGSLRTHAHVHTFLFVFPNLGVSLTVYYGGKSLRQVKRRDGDKTDRKLNGFFSHAHIRCVLNLSLLNNPFFTDNLQTRFRTLT